MNKTILSKDVLSEKELLLALQRGNLFYFAVAMLRVLEPKEMFEDADYMHLLAVKCEEVIFGVRRRFIVNLPPRHLKSHIGTVCAVAFLLGRNPSSRVMVATHTHDLSEELLGKIRALMKSREYRECFPATRVATSADRSDKKDRQSEFSTTAGGAVRAVSFEAAPTGFGCDLLVVDDAIKSDDAQHGERLEKCFAFFTNSLLSRLNDPRKSRVLIIMQRLAVEDLAGKLIGAGGWDVLSLPLVATQHEAIPYNWHGTERIYRRSPGEALHPTRWPPEEIDRKIAEHSDAEFAAIYQQSPLAAGSPIFLEDYFNFCDDLPTSGYIAFQAWDTATSLDRKAAYSVCVTFFVTNDAIYIADVYRRRVTTVEIGDIAEALVARFKPKVVVVEKANSGNTIEDRLTGRKDLTVHPRTPRDTKVARADRCVPVLRSKVRIPRDKPWVDEFLGELRGFPSGRHADQVDALSTGLGWYLDFLSGKVVDPNFRLTTPIVKGVSPTPRLMMQIGRRFVRMGEEHNLRPGSGSKNGRSPPRRR